jgi:DNA-binding XRE family transcriptional regulator
VNVPCGPPPGGDRTYGADPSFGFAPETLGQAIRRLRKAKGWSQTQLANTLGLSVPYVSDVERGRKGMRNAARFAAALGVPLNELPVCAHCGAVP